MSTIFHLFIVANIIIFLLAVVFALLSVRRLRKTSATYNARLLPFAYYSLTIWLLSIVANILTIFVRVFLPDSFLEYMRIGILARNWISVVQIALAVVALKSVYSKKPSKVSTNLIFLFAFSILTAVSFSVGSEIIMSGSYYVLSSLAWAVIYFAFVPAIHRLHLGIIYEVIFIISGLLQFVGLISFGQQQQDTMAAVFVFSSLIRAGTLFCWTRMIVTLLQRAELSHKIAIREIEGLTSLPNPATPFAVMISSTVEDLVQERDASDRAIRSLHLKRFRAETFGSQPHAPRRICEFMAQQCDLFILLIGQRYGYVVESEKISVVQLEYEIARAQNPEKILVYVKDNVEREPQLEEFLQKVQDFESGYFRTSFTTPEELYERIHRDIARWLVAQATQKQPTEKPSLIPSSI